MKKQKLYTVSTIIFESLEDVKEQLLHWDQGNTLNPHTKIFEIKRELQWNKDIAIDGHCHCEGMDNKNE